MTTRNQIEKNNKYIFPPPSSTYYKLVKYNIFLLYQRWIINTTKRIVYEIGREREREREKEKNMNLSFNDCLVSFSYEEMKL
jgi:hypothetical protein